MTAAPGGASQLGAPSPGAAPPTTRRRSPLLWVALALGALVVCAGITVAVLLVVRALRDEPVPVAAHQPAPAAQPQPTPTPAPAPQPQPSAPTTDPFGQLVQTLVDVAGEAARQTGAPTMGQPQPVLQVHEPRVAGDLDAAAIRQVLATAQPSMDRCRVAGQTVQVRAQIRILDPGRISMAAPAPGNPGPAVAAQCCADCFRQAVPQGFDPGSNGVVFFDVTLPAR